MSIEKDIRIELNEAQDKINTLNQNILVLGLDFLEMRVKFDEFKKQFNKISCTGKILPKGR